MLRGFLKMWFLPPISNIVAVLIGVALLKRYPRAGKLMILFSMLSLYAFSTPKCSNFLLRLVELHQPLQVEAARERIDQLANEQNEPRLAIVVLGSGSQFAAQYDSYTIDDNAASRLTYAVWLADKINQPVMLTGGVLRPNVVAHSVLMADYMREHLNAEPDWLETSSRTTYENAKFAAVILKEERISTVILVTNAYHMQRSVRLFEARGLNVIAAPIQSSLRDQGITLRNITPTMDDLQLTYAVLHEFLGLAWYQLRGFE